MSGKTTEKRRGYRCRTFHKIEKVFVLRLQQDGDRCARCGLIYLTGDGVTRTEAIIQFLCAHPHVGEVFAGTAMRAIGQAEGDGLAIAFISNLSNLLRIQPIDHPKTTLFPP